MALTLSSAERALIRRLVAHYKTQDVQERVKKMATVMALHIESSGQLRSQIHSLRWRVKDPSHLREKLGRKMLEAKQRGKRYVASEEDLLVRVTDLAGLRILHLRSDQLPEIDAGLRELFAREKFKLVEKPFARTWDDESRERYISQGFRTEVSPTMYTSVHYVVLSPSSAPVTCEIQVRTLMEEVWGEVDHSINYPRKTRSLACREQLRVLARVASGASRLVDSIYASLEEHQRKTRAGNRTR
jgi:ppGpp synthetase/RelA/SpoT-type nucleotidyltranferase